MTENYSASKLTPVSEMDKDGIIATFDRYKFRDFMGHDLLNCAHFQQLIECAIQSRACGDTSPQQ
jgi:hypothetical protein